MDHQAPGNLSPTLSSTNFLRSHRCDSRARFDHHDDALVDRAHKRGELRLELPANGNIRVENLRGSVIAQVWKESYVSITAVADTGEARSLPAVVDRGQGLLSIRLERGPKGADRVNLELNIPERAHLAINTSDGPVDVRGLPTALLAQSGSEKFTSSFPKMPKPQWSLIPGPEA
jgi:hypothetical protein